MAEITVTIKCSNADKADITCDPTQTVAEFKVLVAQKLSVPADQQRLIFKGRILKDESTLEQYDVQNGQTIHMVKSGGGAPPAASGAAASPPTSSAPQPQTPPSSQPQMPFPNLGNLGQFGGGDFAQMQNQMMQNPAMMQQMMNSPMMQSLLNNPELMSNMILNNPQLQAMMDANPQIRHILNDPELMRQSLQMMSNPNAMQEAMRHQDLAMSRLENHPEGFNALRRMYEDVQEPLMEATQNAMRGQQNQTSQPQTNPWATGTPSSTALPNPWGRPAATPFPQPGNPGIGLGGFPAGGLAGFPGAGAGFPGMNDPAALSAMMQDPMVQQMLRDPQLMMQMARMNPQLSSMLEANPQLQNILSDPETLRRMADPSNLQAMLQMQQSMQQLQRSGLVPGIPPAGFPSFPPTNPATSTPVASTIGGLDFSSLLSAAGSNPSPAAPAASFTSPPSTVSRSPEVRFESQLQQLEGMGFVDRDANIRALIASNGNVNAAVERLLQ